MTTTTTDIDHIERIRDAEEAERLGIAAYRALIADLGRLEPTDWDAITVCAPWTVADMVRHLIGAAKGNASLREMLRQQIHGARHKSDFGENALDATNDLQVADHRHLGPGELVRELEVVAVSSVRRRVRKARFFAAMTVPVDMGGSTASGMPSKINLGHLMRVIYTRDTWLHRMDIARALDRRLALDPDIDGRLVEDVVKEWADTHGRPFDLHLAGPAGGRYRRDGSGPTIELDAMEFCWILSGRDEPAPSAEGAELLGTRVFF